ncbi:membrane protein insertion efficiency factor YidD [Eubacterium sp.]
MKKINAFIKKIMIFLIRTYQVTLSPRFSHGSCRYTPTCSQYAIEAIQIHGIFKGSLLAVRRILRCNPFFKGGYDPVPMKKTKQEDNYR